jgi:hypothetical protein
MNKIKVLDQVTNADYKKFKSTHSFHPGHENKPVTGVTFTESMEYAKWLSLTTGRRFRLITEDERKEAESTFKADFSHHPLSVMPDVGTFGRNDQGVTGLLGVTYDWCATPDDIADPAALGWVTTSQTKTSPVTLEDLRKLRNELDEKIKSAEAAYKVLSDLGIK